MIQGEINLKLPIKKEFFDKIKSGEKFLECRDAHLTLVCDETREALQVRISFADMIQKHSKIGKEITAEAPECFDPEDPTIIRFWIRLEGA